MKNPDSITMFIETLNPNLDHKSHMVPHFVTGKPYSQPNKLGMANSKFYSHSLGFRVAWTTFVLEPVSLCGIFVLCRLITNRTAGHK